MPSGRSLAEPVHYDGRAETEALKARYAAWLGGSDAELRGEEEERGGGGGGRGFVPAVPGGEGPRLTNGARRFSSTDP